MAGSEWSRGQTKMAEDKIVQLERSPQGGFGFSVIGGVNTHIPPMVSALVHNGPAQLSGKINVGDVIIEVNKVCVTPFKTEEVVKQILLSMDVMEMRLREDTAARLRAKRYLRVNSIEGPRLPGQSGTNLRRSVSAPSKPRLKVYKCTNDPNLRYVTLNDKAAMPSLKFAVEKNHMNHEVLGNDTHPNVGIDGVYKQRSKSTSNTQCLAINGGLPYQSGISRSESVNVPNRNLAYGVRPSALDTYNNPGLKKPPSKGCLYSSNCPSCGFSVNMNSASEQQSVQTSKMAHRLPPGVLQNSCTCHGSAPCLSPVSRVKHAKSQSCSCSACATGLVTGHTCGALPTSGSEDVLDKPSQQTRPNNLFLNNCNTDMNSVASLDNNHPRDSRGIPYSPHRAKQTLSPLVVHKNYSASALHSCYHHHYNNCSKHSHSDGSLDSKCTNANEQNSSKCCNQNHNGGVLLSNSKEGLNFSYRGGSADKLSVQGNLSGTDSSLASANTLGCGTSEVKEDLAKTPENESSKDIARRLYFLEGFKKSQVAPQLSKNTDFGRDIALEYLRYFDFTGESLVAGLREVLRTFPLTGETQERERILIPFSKRFWQCNKPQYGTDDAVHTLVCALMLLNTDLHGEKIGKKMTMNQFIDNLSGLCDDGDFPKEVLKDLYQELKSQPLEWCQSDTLLQNLAKPMTNGVKASPKTGNPFIARMETSGDDIVYKEGLLYRKVTMESDGRKTSAWKRKWQPFYCVLKGMVLYLQKAFESECCPVCLPSPSIILRNKPEEMHKVVEETRYSIGIHHSLASHAPDYKKRPAVFRFISADWKVFLYQARNMIDMQEWIQALNLVAAQFSAPPLPAPIGSSKKFQRPVLPFSKSRLNFIQQLEHHEKKSAEVEDELIEHLKLQPNITLSKDLEEWQEKHGFLEFEYKRYKSYVNILKSSKLQSRSRDKPLPCSKSALDPQQKIALQVKRSSSMSDIREMADFNISSRRRNRESYLMAIYQ